MSKKIVENVILFLIYGLIYFIIETIYKYPRPSHWTMFVLGGILGIIIGMLNEDLSWETPIWLQSVVGGCIVTIFELFFGLILNVWLGLNIWDYSDLPCNFMGQICLQFTLIWCVLSIVCIVLDDWLRYWLFGEEKPHYVW